MERDSFGSTSGNKCTQQYRSLPAAMIGNYVCNKQHSLCAQCTWKVRRNASTGFNVNRWSSNYVKSHSL